jgi:hypothetical protein
MRFQMFYEVTWNVNAFASRWDTSSGKWPFVWSTGDPTGYSWSGSVRGPARHSACLL